jgi:CRISPR-associated protein Csm4
MSTYAFDLTFLSPVTHLPSAQSLFGHLAWWERYSQGEDALEALLHAFADSPPFLLSSAFPAGFLPKPLLPPVQDERLEDSRFRKLSKRLRYLSFPAFQGVIEHGERAFLDLVEREDGTTRAQLEIVTRTRVGINRQTGTAQEGILFTETVTQPQGRWTVYMRPLHGAYSPDWLAASLRAIGEQGYGGRASVGLGRFSVAGPQEVVLPEAKGANAYTTLAPCLPHAEGYYALETYWGRLGGHFAHHDNPFKRPYLRAKVGSSFRGEAREAGRLLPVADLGEGTIYDYLYPFPVAVKLSEDA